MQVGGVEIEVGVTLAFQRPVLLCRRLRLQERLHLQIDLSADAAQLGLGDPTLAAERRDEGIDLVPPARWPWAR